MKRLLKYTSLILMVLMASGSVWAYDYNDHVTVAPNNKGDVLIFPYYLAVDGGWQTKLTVINTDEVNSIVAKLVIRSFRNSEELLDFFLYLTPADVWTGTMMYDAVLGKVVIHSSDDSCLASSSGTTLDTLVWANQTTPTVQTLHQELFPAKCSGDADYLGYIEVFTAASGNAGARPLVKKTLWSEYDKLKLGSQSLLRYAAFAPTRPNVLAGYMQLQNPAAGLDSSLRATTLKDYLNFQLMDTNAETRLGEKARNSLGEVEAALTKDDIAMPYVNDKDIAIHIFTFPTKLTNVDDGCEVSDTENLKVRGPYFNMPPHVSTQYCVEYNTIVYNLQEQTPGSGFSGGGESTRTFCDEVNIVAADIYPAGYTEGWAHYLFPNDTYFTTAPAFLFPLQISYYGAPVVPSYLSIGATGLSANYGAWDDEMVFCGTTTATSLMDYQYSDAAPATGCR